MLRRDRRGLTATVLLLGLAGVSLVLGFLASSHSLGALRNLEQIQAQRLRDLAADSAIEEACSSIESKMSAITPPSAGEDRDLSGTLTWPDGTRLTDEHSSRAGHTAGAFAADGVKLLSPVRLRSSSWIAEWVDGGTEKVIERGLIKITQDIQVKRGPITKSWRVTVRRYGTVRNEPGSTKLVFHVMPENLGREVVALP